MKSALVRRRVVTVLSICLPLLVAGCGQSDRLKTYPVSGTVKYEDGEVVTAGTILFVSENCPIPAKANITDGQFTLGTYEADDGAVEGEHKIAVIPAPPEDFDPDSGQTFVSVKQETMRPDSSGLVRQVEADQKNDFEIVVEKAKR